MLAGKISPQRQKAFFREMPQTFSATYGGLQNLGNSIGNSSPQNQ